MRESALRVLPYLELDQVYAVQTGLKTHNRFQSPPFRTDTNLRILGRQRNDAVEVWAHYTTDVFTDREDGDEEPVWTVKVECVAVFEAKVEDPDFEDKDLEAFALLVGAPALHPYAREWTQTLSSHSQYPAFTIGLLDSIAELPEDEEIELTEPEQATDMVD